MYRTFLFAKIHRATVTAANVLLMDEHNRIAEVRRAEVAGEICR